MDATRKGRIRLGLLLAALAGASALYAGTRQEPTGTVADIRLPAGFSIDVYADGVEGARQMARGAEGIVYVGSRRAGLVHAVVDLDGDARADEVHVIARELNLPSGVAYRDGALYVAEVGRILRFDGIDGRVRSPPEPVVVTDTFPEDRHHGWKFIGFGRDGKLYVPVGAPCNICDPALPYAALHRMNPDGSELEVYARGIRNTVGFDWHPVTGDLWFTDNGRDMLGDHRPPDELNRIRMAGQHFGYPFCHGGTLPDPEFGGRDACEPYTAPAQRLRPHIAAIGMRFYTGTMFPEAYRNQIIIAEHGSWNRSVPAGYRLSLVTLHDSQPVSYDVFAEGWLKDGQAWGRPADVLVMPDGALLVADDMGGKIFRISYSEPEEEGG